MESESLHRSELHSKIWPDPLLPVLQMRQINYSETEGKNYGSLGFVPASQVALQPMCSMPWAPSGIRGTLL